MVPKRIYRSLPRMKFRDCTSMNSTENIQEGSRNGLSKTALGFENCKQQLFTLTMCLPACLRAQNCQDPVWLHDDSSGASCKMWWLSISESDSSVSSIRKKLSYRKHVHHNPSIKYASRCWAKRKWLHILWDKQFPEVRTNRALKSTMIKRLYLLLPQ